LDQNEAHRVADELREFDNDIDEVIQCFYIWRTIHAAARKSRRVYDLLNRNAGFWVVALGSIQTNSLIALGRIFDRGKDTHNVGRLLRLAAKNPAIFSKAALRHRKEKDLANTSHLVDDFMRDVKEPTTSDFTRLGQFVDARRKVYEKCYKQLRDKRYAHKQRTDMSGIFARTNTRELARLVTDLSKLHRVLWDWYHNGMKPRTSRLRGTAGKQIERDTRKFLKSLTS
jgi:AbiU2